MPSRASRKTAPDRPAAVLPLRAVRRRFIRIANSGGHASRRWPPASGRFRRGAQLERRRHRFVDPLEPHEGQLLSHLFRNVFEVLPVARRKHHAPDPGPVRRDDFFLDAANRQHQSAQADLSGHCGVAAYRAISQEGDQRHEHRHPGARAVLRGGSRRHMDVDVGLFKARGIDRKRRRPILDDAERGLGALPHHLAELTSEDQPVRFPGWRSPR